MTRTGVLLWWFVLSLAPATATVRAQEALPPENAGSPQPLLIDTTDRTDPANADPLASEDPFDTVPGLEFDDEFDLSLEELMATEIEVVAGRAESLIETPAAVTIITREEIHRAGYTTVMEALRLVPGMQVSRIAADSWAISSRGFNNRFSSMLLVLVDGRAIYNDLFAGVYWDEVAIPIDAISHIEVIRGPGATIWGANAVNGVINIVTRRAEGTESGLVVGQFGDEVESRTELHYDGRLSDTTTYRVFGSWLEQESFSADGFSDAGDDWRQKRLGVRVDSALGDGWDLSVHAQVYGGVSGSPARIQTGTAGVSNQEFLDTVLDGNHALVTLERDEPDAGWWQISAYYDYARRNSGDTNLRRKTGEISVKHRWTIGEDHSLVAGASYRHRAQELLGTFTVLFPEEDRSTDLITLFLQDTVRLSDSWDLMVGSKLEHNDMTGFEVQPGLRARYTPDDDRTYWAAISRAVRVPSLLDQGLEFVLQVLPGPTPVRVLGDPDAEAEELIAFELGHRHVLTERWSYDVALFHNRYDDVIAFRSTAVPTDQLLTNNGEILSYGAELSLTHDFSESLRLGLNYAFLSMDGSNAAVRSEAAQQARNIATLRARWHLHDDFDLNGSLGFVDRVPDADVGSYTRLDLGLTWRPRPGLEVSLWGQNLIDAHHVEMTDPFLQGIEIDVPRSAYLRVSWEFD